MKSYNIIFLVFLPPIPHSENWLEAGWRCLTKEKVSTRPRSTGLRSARVSLASLGLLQPMEAFWFIRFQSNIIFFMKIKITYYEYYFKCAYFFAAHWLAISSTILILAVFDRKTYGGDFDSFTVKISWGEHLYFNGKIQKTVKLGRSGTNGLSHI